MLMVANCQSHAKANTDSVMKKKVLLRFQRLHPWHWYDLSFKGIFLMSFWFTFWPLNKIQLLDPLNYSLLPPSAEGEPVCPWRWGFIGGYGIPNYTFKMPKNPRTLPNNPIRSFSVTPTLCLADMEVCIMLEDVSYSLHVAWTDLKRASLFVALSSYIG